MGATAKTAHQSFLKATSLDHLPPSSADDFALFRREVREFAVANVSPEVRRRILLGKPATKDETMGWHRALHLKGWVAPAWPTAFGGPGWSLEQRWVFDEELALVGAPQLSAPGLTTVGPVLISSGSVEQQARYLTSILEGSEIWCQGFSESGAGSDLAALLCRAAPTAGGYRVTGSKIWTTHAHWADFCLLLGRSSNTGRKQDGITMLIVDMRAHGVSLQPIVTLDGLHVLNQCFFDDVFVADVDRIGEEGQAWSILKGSIGHERVLVANPGLARVFRQRVLTLATASDVNGQRAIDSPGIRSRIILLEVRLRALEATALRVLAKPDLATSPESSLLKIIGTELQQDYIRLIGDVLGDASLPYDKDWLESPEVDECSCFDAATPNYLFLRKASISAGTNEVQRDIIARALLR